MITIIVYGLLYVLGVLVSYVSTVLYFYYIDNPSTHKENKLEFAVEKTIDGFRECLFFLSWLYFIALTVYVLIKIIKIRHK